MARKKKNQPPSVLTPVADAGNQQLLDALDSTSEAAPPADVDLPPADSEQLAANGIRNRVIGRQRMNVDDLASNERNWRTHPESQREAMLGVLDEIGQVGELYAYYSERNGNALTLIDGHLRKDIGGEWDIAITDLDDAEADKLLAVYDPLGAAATADKDKLDALLRDIQTESKPMADLLTALAEQHAVIPPTADSEPVDGNSGQPALNEKWLVLVECADEAAQTAILERFTAEGLTCRALIA